MIKSELNKKKVKYFHSGHRSWSTRVLTISEDS